MTLCFDITFNGPFRIGAGAPINGYDAPVDRTNPLPSTSLKGLMRAEASERLGLPTELVARVFGSKHHECPWVWSDATLTSPRFGPSTKVRVDDDGHAMRGFLRFGEQVWAASGSFTVEQRLHIPEEELGRHRTVLFAAAASITALGESRLRGSGWVVVRGRDAQPDLPAELFKLVRAVAS